MMNDIDLDEDSGLAYRTLTGFEHHPRWKNKLQTMFKRPSELTLLRGGSARSSTGSQFGISVLPTLVTDMTIDDVAQWEDEQMKEEVDVSSCKIDPAPFQLVEKTSLVKVHSLFSMVGVNMAYVTTIGQLVGVVGLKELRAGIENANGIKPTVAPAAPPQADNGSPEDRDPEKAVAEPSSKEERESLLTNDSPKSAAIENNTTQNRSKED